MKLHAVIGDAGPGNPFADRARLAALRTGSVEVVAELYDSCHQRVRRLARRLLGDDGAAEDVVQEAFAAIPHALRSFRGSADVQSFLLGIAVKKARSHLRSTIRSRRALERLARETMPQPHDPEQHAYREQLARRLVWALDRLPPAQREAFVLCEVETMAAAEAALILGIPDATVRTRLFHARARLRVLLADEVP
ncbi:MAG: RNA polymerase sigma factor [Deltaproteobacteria bacterium]|nr:RNA polymerase sigma factor [Deltaproteobacteria bacterium]